MKEFSLKFPLKPHPQKLCVKLHEVWYISQDGSDLNYYAQRKWVFRNPTLFLYIRCRVWGGSNQIAIHSSELTSFTLSGTLILLFFRLLKMIASQWKLAEIHAIPLSILGALLSLNPSVTKWGSKFGFVLTPSSSPYTIRQIWRPINFAE